MLTGIAHLTFTNGVNPAEVSWYRVPSHAFANCLTASPAKSMSALTGNNWGVYSTSTGPLVGFFGNESSVGPFSKRNVRDPGLMLFTLNKNYCQPLKIPSVLPKKGLPNPLQIFGLAGIQGHL